MPTDSETSTNSVVLDPRGEISAEETPITTRLNSMEGATVGLLSNSKANADVLLEKVGEILVEEHGVEATIHRQKDKSPIPADGLAEQLNSKCDAVVNAYGDCGSCTSWLIYDSIDLERQGTPTATINSDEFVTLGQSETRSLGMPGLPITTVPHPMGGIPEAEAKARGEDIVPTLVSLLTTDREQLETEYKNKYLATAGGL